jgi:hypothetical protein
VSPDATLACMLQLHGCSGCFPWCLLSGYSPALP